MRLLLPALVLVAACGGDGGSDDGTGPPPGAFDCLGDPLPTTAADPITVSGQVLANFLAPAPLEDAQVVAFTSAAVELDFDSSDAAGMYALSVATGGTPLNGYVRVTRAGAGLTYIPTYAYPAVPLAGDAVQNILVPTTGEIDLLEFATGVTQQAGNGLIGVVVEDCDGMPVQGAVVSTSPAGTVRYNAAGAPSSTATSTDADGVAFVFNVTAGDVTVNASAGALVLRGHVVNARPDAVTLTGVVP